MTAPLHNLIRTEIRGLSAYHVPNASNMIKLDAMENPYTLPAELISQWKSGLAEIEFNRYPDPSAKKLQKKMSVAMHVPEGMATLLGNGSDEIIQILAMSVAGADKCLLSFEPGFVMYRMIAEFVGMKYVGVPLASNFTIDINATVEAIKQHQPAIIFIAYPNNPTANVFSDSDIEHILKIASGFVVVDEAYQPFAQTSFMSRLNDYDNLLVMRTVSKMGLAGLRLGMLAGRPEYIEEFNKVRLPYNVNVLTQYTAEFMLEHIDVLNEQAAKIREQRTVLFAQLSELAGIEVFPSQANFILFRLLEGKVDEVFKALCEKNILIKNMKAKKGALKNCLRVTVGTPEENTKFIDAFKHVLNNTEH